MAYSAATYKGDGSQSTFIIPFDYLQKDFVKVTINEVDKVYAQDYNVDGRELSFPTAPPSGSIIKVYRETPTDRMVKWNEGSVLTSSNMTTQQIQELHLIEETTYNLEESAMVKTEDNHKWEGRYLPITHVGDPTDDSDVVNLGMIKKEETGFLASVRSQLDKWLADLGTTYNSYSKSLKESFDSHTSSLKNQFDTHTASLLSDFNNYKDTLKTTYDTYTSNLSTTFKDYKTTLLNKYNEYLTSLTATKDAVKDSEANANKYKDEAKASAKQAADSVATCTTRVTEANQAKESASASANTATTKATESGNSASLAKKWAVSTESPDGAVGSKSSKTWAEEAKASEQKAATSANNAKGSENNAKTSEENAKASETASANSASASAKSATAAKGSEDKAKTSEVNAKASEVAAAESAKQAAAGQINADWNETDADSKAYIKNKPDVLLKTGGTATGTIIAPSFQTDTDDSHYVKFSKLRGQGGIDTYYHAIDFGYSGHDKVDFYEIKGVYNFHSCHTGRIADATRIGSIQERLGWNGLVKGQDIPSAVSTKSLTVTGETSVPTANEGNSSNTIASTEFVTKSLAKMVDSAPESLNTLNELAKALGNDPNFATTVLNELGKKMNSVEATDTFATKTEAGGLSGTVVAFSGAFEDGYPIDKNTGLANKKWHLCDGTNGTPDLRQRFILGGDGTDSGTTGGEASVTLTVQTIPAHGHTGTTSTNGDHSHTVTTFNEFRKINGNNYDGYCAGSTNRTTSTNGNHQHNLNIDSTGGGQPHNNMPPYYVLAYIMKL